MAFAYEIQTTGAAELRVKYQDAPALVHSNTVRLMTRIVARLHTYAVTRKLSGSPLKARTRNLARALFHRVELVGQDIVGRVGVDLKKAIYGRIHEKGGVIKPIKGTYLTVPIGAALTAGGAQRFTARQVISSPEAYGFEDTFVHKNIIFGTKGRYRSAKVEGQRAKVRVGSLGSVVPLFVLKRSITMPERSYLASTLKENERDVVHELETGIVDAVKKL